MIAPRTLPALPARAAERSPGATALVDDAAAVRLSYRELWDEVDEQARELAQAGYRAQAPLPLTMPPGWRAVVRLLAGALAGAVVVPVDPTTPSRRLDELAGRLARALRPPARLLPDGHQDLLAIVLHTSGSTGAPKAVGITHGSLYAFAASAAGFHQMTSSDRVLVASTPASDFFLEELLLAFGVGATATLLPRSADVTDTGFLEWLQRQRVSVLDLPTARWRALADLLLREDRRLPDCVRRIVVGGEELLASDLEAWRSGHCGTATLCNAYGPTETTIVSNAYVLSEADRQRPPSAVPIGRPLSGVHCHAVDAEGRPVAAGESGELLIGGSGIGYGYLGDPRATARCFVPDWLSGEPGGRLYRTGDLVRRSASGGLVFAGRLDGQVKIRGHRLEPAEVEAVLRHCPGVRQAAVAAHPDPDGELRLVAYLAEPAPDPGSVRGFLAERLPEWMRPSAYQVLAELPTTATGKVARSRLAPPAWGADRAASNGSRQPASPTERALAELWSEVLGRGDVGRGDNFFDLGGHSLKAMQLVLRARQRLDRKVELVDVFEAPVLADLARLLDSRAVAGAGR